jgi:hypothetical protein
VRSTKPPSLSERLLGLVPQPVPPFVFEVDERGVRFGRFQDAEGGVRFLEYRELGLPSNSFQDGVLGGPMRDPAGFTEFLGNLLEEISVPVQEACLVIPDRWLRVSFVEVGELPRDLGAQEEILRWKLKRLVPFRTEDLRVRGMEVEPLPKQEEAARVLLGYGLERLLKQLEEAFDTAGIHIGLLTNRSLSLLAGMAGTFATDDISVLAVVRNDAYSLTFSKGVSPLLLRFKEGRGADMALEGNLVSRDLRLTGSFLRQQFPGVELGKILLAAPVDLAPEWLSWISDGFGAQADSLRVEHLSLVGDMQSAPWWEAIAMIGASRLEVR